MTAEQLPLPAAPAPSPASVWRPDRLLAQVELTDEQVRRVTLRAAVEGRPWSLVYREMHEAGEL